MSGVRNWEDSGRRNALAIAKRVTIAEWRDATPDEMQQLIGVAVLTLDLTLAQCEQIADRINALSEAAKAERTAGGQLS